jgi:hypothetical protein
MGWQVGGRFLPASARKNHCWTGKSPRKSKPDLRGLNAYAFTMQSTGQTSMHCDSSK